MTRYVVRLKARATGALRDDAVYHTREGAAAHLARMVQLPAWESGRIVKVQAAQALQRRFRR